MYVVYMYEVMWFCFIILVLLLESFKFVDILDILKEFKFYVCF